MRRFGAVFAREYLERVRTRWFIIATVFGPILLSALIVLPAILGTRAARQTRLGETVILDATGTELGARVAAAIADPSRSEPLTDVRRVTAGGLAQAEAEATAAVMAQDRRGYLVLDERTMAGLTTRYAGRDATSPPMMERLERALSDAVLSLRLENEGLSVDQVESVTRVRPRLQAEQITDRGRGGSGMASFLLAFVVALYLYAAIILYGQNVLRGVMEEKQTRVAEVVLSSVSANTLLAGKVLGVGAVGLTQLLVWTVSGVAIYRLREPLMATMGMSAPAAMTLPDVSLLVWVVYLAYFVLGFLFYAALFAAVGAMVGSEQEAQQAAQPVMLLIVASVVFMQPVLLDPAGGLARTMTTLPFSSPILMPMRLSMVPVPPGELAASLVVLAASCVAALWLSARIYRVGILMYGKRASLREVARWVRYA
ncbi:MAG TPA: ABC transporter permease [Gemmatimonadaceae bacterium]|nr:ABC transporter permease [Gemmatimonadaceae bacterium]